ncbi:MAG: efflux RND transporter periplasmic adaptor subunit [Thermoanaerobaculia bacterium]
MNLKKTLLPVAFLLLSGLAAAALVRTRPEAETQEVTILAPLVRVLTVAPKNLTLDVRAQGTVLPRTETTLIAQVAGTVTAVSGDFEAGGFFRRGEVLVELDPRDYQIAMRRAGAQVAQAELQVELQEAEARVAIEEWRELGDGEPSPLVLRQPQLAQAKAGLEAARAELEKAGLDLERTRIRAPFTGRVRGKRVDLGQFVSPGTPLATVHATDYAEVRLPVPDDQLGYLELPFTYRNAVSDTGPAVTLRARFGRRQHAWQGHIVRTEGEIDGRTRMLNLVARIEKPYDRSPDAPDRPPLAVGTFVEAEIAGRAAEGVFVVPRVALRPTRRGLGEQVLVADDDDRLRFRDVEVSRLEGETAVISAGLTAGERVCVSPLDVAVDGMKVRTVETDDGSGGEAPS